MEKQISIIIPTYNMEAFIGKCLNSLLIPDFDKVEVLVVNDGSKDRSSEIAHDYADKYPKSIRVIDKPNGNYGSCINTALPLAAGRYIKVLDADDTFDTESFSQLVDKLSNTDVDLVLTDYNRVDAYGIIFENCEYQMDCDKKITASQLFDLWTRKKERVAMHSFTYSRKIFELFEYHQTEGISYTDTEWVLIPLHYVKTAIYYKLPIYRYLVGRDGQSVGLSSLIRNLNHLMKIISRLVSLTSDYKDNEESDFIRCFLGIRIKQIYSTTLRYSYPGNNSYLSELHLDISRYQWVKELISGFECSNFPYIKHKYVNYWENKGRRSNIPVLLINSYFRRLKFKK